MRWLIGCEQFGAVRRALRARGVDAWSCDLEPARDGSPHHIQGDLWSVAHDGWDAGIFHPDCTYLTNSAAWAFADPDFGRYPGVGYHQRVQPETLVGSARREAREAALEDVRRMMALPYPTAIENPIGAISSAIRPPDQIIQPYQLGDDASKATCLWLNGLPPLRIDPAARRSGRIVNGRERWSNQTDSGQNRLSPGADRAMQRAETYPGIAAAIADQWPAAIAERKAA